MYKFLALISALFVLSGCVEKQPHITEYRIDASTTPKSYEDSACSQKSLKVARSFGSNIFMKEDMSYAIGSYEIENFNESKWVLAPTQAINAEVRELLKKSKLFKDVQGSKTLSKNDYILEISVEDFMQYFSEDTKKSYANVRLSFTLIDYKSAKTVASKSFNAKVDVKEQNAKGGVEALNSALEDVLIQLQLWLVKVCV